MAKRERKRVGLTVRFEPGMMRDVRKVAKADKDRSVADTIRILLREALDARKAVTP